MVTSNTAPDEIVLTIFTPAYNRASLLPRLFDSVAGQVQAGDAVEWLVIDDGSTDNTPGVLANFAARRPGLVRYERVSNGGKHRAINRAAHLARGRWIMIVDSDDHLTPQAVANVRRAVAQIDADHQVGLVRGLRNFPDLAVEHRFAIPANPCTHAKWVGAQASFDTAEVVRTVALRQHPFPDFEGERFMAEGWLWHSLDKTHLTKFVNEAWVTCYYQAEGLSANSQRIRAASPIGAMAVYAEMLQSPLPLHLSVRAAINGWRYWFHAKSKYGEALQPRMAPLWTVPLGWWLYRLDKKALA